MKKKPYEQKMYKEKKKKNKIRMRFDFNRKGVIFFAVAAFIICAVSIIGTDMGWIDQGGVVSSLKRNSADAPVTYGKVLSQDETTENGKTGVHAESQDPGKTYQRPDRRAELLQHHSVCEK